MSGKAKKTKAGKAKKTKAGKAKKTKDGRRGWGSGSIVERSEGTWRVTVELPRDPLTGSRRRNRFTVKGGNTDAQAALTKAMIERNDGGVDPSGITTAEWLTRRIDQRVRDDKLAPNTVANYRGIIKKHLVPSVGDVPLQKLRAADIRALKENLLQSSEPATVRKVLQLLKSALERAVSEELLARNPALDVPIPSVGRNKQSQSRALNRDEVKELVEVAEGTPYATVIRFTVATGARQAEVLGATWDAIDLERGSFTVTHTLQFVGGEPQMLRPKTKNSRRNIDLSDATVQLLREHRDAQNAQRDTAGIEWEDHDLVFPDQRGRHQHRGAFYGGFRKLVDGSGITDPETVTFHSLRHTAATLWLLEPGASTFVVSRRLGHASAAFTMDVYGHMVRGEQRGVAAALDDLLG